MKFLLLILTVLAIGRVCSTCEELAQACVDNLLNSLMGETSEGEVCGELRHAIRCLEEAMDECNKKEDKDDIEEGLGELSDILRESCEKDRGQPKTVMRVAQRHHEQEEELEEISTCFAANEGYINQCMYEGSTVAMSVLSADVNEDLFKCAMYGMMASCFVERVEEKCGDKAAEIADRQLANLPADITDACRHAGVSDNYAFHFASEKRRK